MILYTCSNQVYCTVYKSVNNRRVARNEVFCDDAITSTDDAETTRSDIAFQILAVHGKHGKTRLLQMRPPFTTFGQRFGSNVSTEITVSFRHYFL